MRLVLGAPGEWTAEDLPEGRRIFRVSGFSGKPDLVVVTFPLVSRPEPVAAMVGPFLGRDVPPGCNVRVTGASDTSTAAGAPLHLVDAEVTDTAGALLEQRIAAFYQLAVFTGTAMVRAKPPGRLGAHRDVLLEVLRSGRADLSGQVASLAQLFDGMVLAWGNGDPWVS
jgi:hypothetical protein